MAQNTNSSETAEGINVTEMMKVPEGCIVFPLSTFAPWNHSEDLVSLSTQQMLKEIVDVYLLTPLFVLSVPLNVINMIVFWKHGIKERINLCLFSLSFSDIIVVAGQFEIKLDGLYAAVTNTPYKLVVAKYSINSMVHSLTSFMYISGFISTLIAMERCLCVVSPLKAQAMFQTKTTAIVLALGHIVIFVFFIVVIASEWTVVCMYDPLTGRTQDNYYPSQFYFDNQQLVQIFNGIIFGVLLPGLLVFGVSLCTVVTVIKLRQMMKWRQQSSSASTSGEGATKDMTLTRMLIGTNILFLVCTAPPLVFHTLMIITPELSLVGKYYNTYNFLTSIHELCAYTNSSFNFFIYYFFGTKFRTTIKHMFRVCFNTGEKISGDVS